MKLKYLFCSWPSNGIQNVNEYVDSCSFSALFRQDITGTALDSKFTGSYSIAYSGVRH